MTFVRSQPCFKLVLSILLSGVNVVFVCTINGGSYCGGMVMLLNQHDPVNISLVNATMALPLDKSFMLYCALR